jgi:phosphatidylcholine synthase
MRALQGLTLTLSVVWAATYAVLVLQFPDPHPVVIAASLAYIVYYCGLSFWMTARGARAPRVAGSAERGQTG